MTAPDAAGPPSRLFRVGVFGVSFAALLTMLLVRSRDLFSRVIYEEGDFAANSIITYQAKHFDLLVGNYSRIGFSHPGPAYFYLQAAGEWLLHDLLHLVPSPWNGQAVGILALNAACVALALTVIYGWVRSIAPVAAAGGVALVYFAAHGQLVTSTWMPYAYFTPFLLLLVAAASVAAGRTRHLWLLALAGGLLVHGHAEFLFFVPLITGAAVLLHLRERRRWGRGNATRRDVLVALGVLAVFLLPMMLNLALHWPGEFGAYLAYGGGAGVHPPGEALRYQLQFWAANRYLALAAAVALFTGVRLLAHLARGREHGRLLLAGWRASALASVLFFGYASYGIDGLHENYVGYFSRAIPLALMLLGAAGCAALLPHTGRWRAAAPALGATTLAVGLVAAGLSSDLVNRRGEVPGVPHALDVMAARAGGRPIVLDVRPHSAWPEATPLVIGGLRRGQRVCLREAHWRVVVTDRFVCTAGELVDGERFVLGRPDQIPPGATVVAEVHPSVVSLPAPG